MSKKRQRYRLAKEIRKDTGLTMSICLVLAPMVEDRVSPEWSEPKSKTAEKAYKTISGPHYCGDGCCGPGWTIKGPKGTYHYGYL